MKKYVFALIFISLLISPAPLQAQENLLFDAETTDDSDSLETASAIFDDKMLLEGYAKKYNDVPKEILLEMIKDDTLNGFKTAAAVKVLREKFGPEIVSREKRIVERILLRRLDRTDSPFVQVEIMHTLCELDRYRYFAGMVPALIQKMDHYNATVNDLAYEGLEHIIIKAEITRPREARIVFDTFRKVLFLSRKRLIKIDAPGEKLTRKIQLLRWSIKVLGSDVINKLPEEVINLL